MDDGKEEGNKKKSPCMGKATRYLLVLAAVQSRLFVDTLAREITAVVPRLILLVDQGLVVAACKVRQGVTDFPNTDRL